jgi:hypothetical protein
MCALGTHERHVASLLRWEVAMFSLTSVVPAPSTGMMGREWLEEVDFGGPGVALLGVGGSVAV